MSFYSHAQIPRYKGQGKKKTSGQKAGDKVTCMRAEDKSSLWAAGLDSRASWSTGLWSGWVLSFLMKCHWTPGMVAHAYYSATWGSDLRTA